MISTDQVVEARRKMEAAKLELDSASKDFTKAVDLYFAENPSYVFSASSRCKCGAAMAYREGSGPDGAWECWTVLSAKRDLVQAPEGVHDEFPFAFYSVKSESQPSVDGRTTRPPELPKYQPHPWHDVVFKKKES